MKRFRVKITETYVYEIDVTAEDRKEAFDEAKEKYEDVKDGYLGTKNSGCHESMNYKILKEDYLDII